MYVSQVKNDIKGKENISKGTLTHKYFQAGT